MTNEANRPWWETDPTIIAKRLEVEKWIESLEAEEVDPQAEAKALEKDSAIRRELSTGECRDELREARKDLDRARVRYADAVAAARAVGYSWGEIGEALGVARQLLHRRFRYEVD